MADGGVLNKLELHLSFELFCCFVQDYYFKEFEDYLLFGSILKKVLETLRIYIIYEVNKLLRDFVFSKMYKAESLQMIQVE